MPRRARLESNGSPAHCGLNAVHPVDASIRPPPHDGDPKIICFVGKIAGCTDAAFRSDSQS
jgi:hypothetical protein